MAFIIFIIIMAFIIISTTIIIIYAYIHTNINLLITIYTSVWWSSMGNLLSHVESNSQNHVTHWKLLFYVTNIQNWHSF